MIPGERLLSGMEKIKSLIGIEDGECGAAPLLFLPGFYLITDGNRTHIIFLFQYLVKQVI